MNRCPESAGLALRACEPGVDPSLFVAAAEHFARNVEAVSDSVLAAMHGVGEAHAYLVGCGAEALGQRIAAAAALAAARQPADLIAAQREIGRRAVESYAASACVLGALLTAGARASREPLLERLR